MFRVLFITEDYPSGLNGTSVKTRNTLQYMLDHDFEIDLCCAYVDSVENRLNHKNLRHFLVEKKLPAKYSLPYFLRAFRLLISSNPLVIQRVHDENLGKLVKVLASSNEYDYVIYDGYSTLTSYVSTKDQTIYIDDEDFTDLLRQRIDFMGFGLSKMLLRLDYLKSKSFEQKLFPQLDQIWAISPNTGKRLSSLSSAETSLMPTYVPSKKNIHQLESKDLVFTGTLSWPENIAGLKWFLKNHWFKIHNRFPDTILKIVGREASSELKKFIKSFPQTEFLGYVQDLKQVYRNSAVAIAPVLINAGIKVKILTYWSYGLPVVATKTSALGLVSYDGLVLGDEQSFADKVIELLASKEKRQRLSKLAFENIKSNYSRFHLEQFLEERLNL